MSYFFKPQSIWTDQFSYEYGASKVKTLPSITINTSKKHTDMQMHFNNACLDLAKDDDNGDKDGVDGDYNDCYDDNDDAADEDDDNNSDGDDDSIKPIIIMVKKTMQMYNSTKQHQIIQHGWQD